ncbi:MAG: hypothetical protein ACR2KX_06135, partial [Chitinophagaceae bacterium]
YSALKFILTILFFLLIIFSHAQQQKQLAATPPMGWNSWTILGRKTSNSLVSLTDIQSNLNFDNTSRSIAEFNK